MRTITANMAGRLLLLSSSLGIAIAAPLVRRMEDDSGYYDDNPMGSEQHSYLSPEEDRILERYSHTPLPGIYIDSSHNTGEPPNLDPSSQYRSGLYGTHVGQWRPATDTTGQHMTSQSITDPQSTYSNVNRGYNQQQGAQYETAGQSPYSNFDAYYSQPVAQYTTHSQSTHSNFNPGYNQQQVAQYETAGQSPYSNFDAYNQRVAGYYTDSLSPQSSVNYPDNRLFRSNAPSPSQHSTGTASYAHGQQGALYDPYGQPVGRAAVNSYSPATPLYPASNYQQHAPTQQGQYYNQRLLIPSVQNQPNNMLDSTPAVLPGPTSPQDDYSSAYTQPEPPGLEDKYKHPDQLKAVRYELNIRKHLITDYAYRNWPESSQDELTDLERKGVYPFKRGPYKQYYAAESGDQDVADHAGYLQLKLQVTRDKQRDGKDSAVVGSKLSLEADNARRDWFESYNKHVYHQNLEHWLQTDRDWKAPRDARGEVNGARALEYSKARHMIKVKDDKALSDHAMFIILGRWLKDKSTNSMSAAMSQFHKNYDKGDVAEAGPSGSRTGSGPRGH